MLVKVQYIDPDRPNNRLVVEIWEASKVSNQGDGYVQYSGCGRLAHQATLPPDAKIWVLIGNEWVVVK